MSQLNKVSVSHFNTYSYSVRYLLSTLRRLFREEQPNNVHSCSSVITDVRKTMKNTRKVSAFSSTVRTPLNKLIREVPGKGKIWFLTLAAETLSWWESFGERSCDSVSWFHTFASLMTGGEWYTDREDECSPHGPLMLLRTCSGWTLHLPLAWQNSKWPKQDFTYAKGGKIQLVPAFLFLCFLNAAQY